MEKKWEEMSSDEKQEALFQRWLSPEGVKFASPEAEKAYKERVNQAKRCHSNEEIAGQGAGLYHLWLFPRSLCRVYPSRSDV